MTQDQEQPLISHLIELRNRLLKVVLVVAVLFIGLFLFANDLYLILVKPLSALLENHGQMIATGVASPFLVPIKLTSVMAVLLAMPYMLHQAWGFISPGLYQNEKKFAVPLLVSSVVLFYAGVSFAYFVVLPIAFGFFTLAGPQGISIMPDITNILDFCLNMFFAFGFAFEIPVATFLLVLTGITSVEALAEKRSYIFLGCFVVGMLVTPPDVFSQTILALPMYALFELGVIASRVIKTEED
ncbi:twin-arginine translocase subunit TatC [Parathalassolituus penaei]|uniref:Sec-independent protein translocase protein TatC n=1 Tax=Parathalassolituus penaei TaxID=2997323 RepID=A0A9X3IRL0_9GAMM|nr:twin-arginine translocase subunit TatC [Parathalassolituus penaei]MCY0965001.1 twin-arginine translocase subunit TatC [Parathalassolituus penaei]